MSGVVTEVFPHEDGWFVVELRRKTCAEVRSPPSRGKNFSNHIRHLLVELHLRVIIPSTLVWYINMHTIHSKLQFTCVFVKPDINTPNAGLIVPQPQFSTSMYTHTDVNIYIKITATLNLSANVSTRFDHLQMWIAVPSQLVQFMKIPICLYFMCNIFPSYHINL
jgi:hypothetical protein